MISSIRKYKFIRYLWSALALYMLNLSVDATDNLYATQVENLAINNQESIIELVVEKVLGYENAIAEYDDNDNQQTSSFKKFKTLDYVIESYSFLPFECVAKNNNNNPINWYCLNFSIPNLEIVSPPPKV